MEDCSYNADPSFSRNNSKNKERGNRLCVARCLTNTFFWRRDSLSDLDFGRVSVFHGVLPGLDRKAKLAIISAQALTILRAEFGAGPRITIRADNGRFRDLEVPFQPILHRGTFNTIWVILSMIPFLSEPDLRWFL